MLSGDAPSSGLLGEMLRGNRRPDGAFVPCPRCARCSQAPLHQRPSQFGRRRGADGAKLTSLPVASSSLIPKPARLIRSLPIPACWQVLKDARALGDSGQSVPVSVVPTRPHGAAVEHS